MSVKEKNAPASKADKAEKSDKSEKSPKSDAAAAAAAPVSTGPLDYTTVLSKMGSKDRLNVERHIAACEAEPDPAHANNQRRLLGILGGLAPHSIKTHGQQAVQFFIADGKYRMQVFALADLRDGVIMIYTTDVLDEISKSGLLNGPHEMGGHTNAYKIKGSTETIRIDQLDGKTPNPSTFFKDMLGWNRRALRITINGNATKDQIDAVEKICGLGARKWTKA